MRAASASKRRSTKWLWPVRRAASRLSRSRETEGFLRTFRGLAALALLAAVVTNASAATSDAGSGDLRFNKVPYPKVPLHTSYIIEVNRKGQVSRVRSGVSSHDAFFDAMTYGNVLQAFIRTPDGRAISGVYKMIYDYNPDTKKIRRTVSFIHPGGTDPDALGAVDAMSQNNQRALQAIKKTYEQSLHATPKPTRAP